jgi:hypothetical protein
MNFLDWGSTLISVIPAHAGIQAVSYWNRKQTWMPAFAGMTLYFRFLSHQFSDQ